MTQETFEEKSENVDKIPIWKIRECADYRDEHSECISLTGRFQQYFVDGKFTDCSSWKEDLKNCEKFQKNFNDVNAAFAIIRHEDERRKKRLAGHAANDVWEKRKEPPSHWNSELPDFMKESHKTSFIDVEGPSCVIM